MSTILAVDDDETIQRLLEVNLEMEGHEVILAADGDEAMDKIRAIRPDLVLLDIMMPRRDGLSVCRELKNDAELASIPVVILSAKAQQSDIELGEDVGADAYLTKPFDPLDLVELVERLTTG